MNYERDIFNPKRSSLWGDQRSSFPPIRTSAHWFISLGNWRSGAKPASLIRYESRASTINKKTEEKKTATRESRPELLTGELHRSGSTSVWLFGDLGRTRPSGLCRLGLPLLRYVDFRLVRRSSTSDMRHALALEISQWIPEPSRSDPHLTRSSSKLILHPTDRHPKALSASPKEISYLTLPNELQLSSLPHRMVCSSKVSKESSTGFKFITYLDKNTKYFS